MGARCRLLGVLAWLGADAGTEVYAASTCGGVQRSVAAKCSASGYGLLVCGRGGGREFSVTEVTGQCCEIELACILPR